MRTWEWFEVALHGCLGPGPALISPPFDGVIFHVWVCFFFQKGNCSTTRGLFKIIIISFLKF